MGHGPRRTQNERTDVLVGFALLHQLCEAALHDAGGPFVHQTLAVVVSPDDGLDALTHAADQSLQSCGSHRAGGGDTPPNGRFINTFHV